jgi:hypothetical protein
MCPTFRVVNRNLKGSSPKILCQVYLSLIRPIMVHGTPGWHPTTNSNILKLQRIQNRASRYIYGKNFTHELDKKVLPVNSLLVFNDMLYFYRCYHGLIDCNITNVVREGREIRGEGGVCRLIPPCVRTSMYQNGFIYRSVITWNNLPSYVKLAEPSVFKKVLKSYLLDNC